MFRIIIARARLRTKTDCDTPGNCQLIPKLHSRNHTQYVLRKAEATGSKIRHCATSAVALCMYAGQTAKQNFWRHHQLNVTANRHPVLASLLSSDSDSDSQPCLIDRGKVGMIVCRGLDIGILEVDREEGKKKIPSDLDERKMENNLSTI